MEVPAGQSNAYRVEWIGESSTSVSAVNDITSIGLIRRLVTTLTTIGDPEDSDNNSDMLSYDLLEFDGLRLR